MGARNQLFGVFSRAKRAGKWWSENPLADVEPFKVGKRGVGDYLRPQEFLAVLQALPPGQRRKVAATVYLGLRKGELAALQKVDVDLDMGRVTIRRSWGRDKAKGRSEGDRDVLPIHPELRPYLAAAIAESPSELVFPAPNGRMYSERSANFCSGLRAGMAKAGIVEGWRHVCRRRGCTEKLVAPDAAVRRCPAHQAKLWPKPIVRRIRWHDLRRKTRVITCG